MRWLIVVTTICVSSTSMLRTADLQAAEPAAGKGAASEQAMAVAGANTDFACNLYRQIASDAGNRCFSPTSLVSVLGMLELGTAKGKTRDEIRAVRKLTDALNDTGEVAKIIRAGRGFQSANSLWIGEKSGVRSTFQGMLTERFQAELFEVNFGQPDVFQSINQWVAGKTQQNITSLLTGPLPKETEAVIANAVFFQGKWKHPFRYSATKNLTITFTGRADQKYEIPGMPLRAQLKLGEVTVPDAGVVQVLELPLQEEDFSVSIVLPANAAALTQLEKQLTGKLLRELLASASRSSPGPVDVKLPKFSIKKSLQLEEKLQALGMQTAFGGDADFSAIAEKRLKVSRVLHEAFLDVNETGVTAGAATAVPVSAGAGMATTFIADHPFLFLIRHPATGEILFLSRYEAP